jgi:2-phosphosulfolactate phosphatase
MNPPQDDSDIRCEWGSAGLTHCLASSEAVIIVDVLSFSTCVDVAVSQGAQVYPFGTADDSAVAFAEAQGAILASRDRRVGFSLSPASLRSLPAGARLVLPSPNGSALSLATGRLPTFAGCLRNAAAVAGAARASGRRITVIAAGERWPDGSLRFALEDLLGAGALIGHLVGTQSPEAMAAVALFSALESRLPEVLRSCASGRELIERGSADDLPIAAALNASDAAPVLVGGAYRRWQAA